MENSYLRKNHITYDAQLASYMSGVYKNIGAGLLLSGLVAWIVGSSPVLLKLFFDNKIIALLIAFLPLIFSIYFGSQILSKPIEECKRLFYIFASVMGLSLSTIFVVYAHASIVQTFLVTAGTFGVMSIYGYNTKKDITSLRSFLFMGLIGLLIASIVNIFLKSPGFDFSLSLIGVILFTLFTVYDVNKVKQLYLRANGNSELIDKLALLGAFELYLDFVNLFLYILRFVGRNERS